MKDNDRIRENIIRDMAEGGMVIGLDGKIILVNRSALSIFGRTEDELIGKPFAACFFGEEENDAFNQLILDAVYDRGSRHEEIVPFVSGNSVKTLRVSTSFLTEEGRRIALIVVLSDITELAELRDAVKAMKRIEALNKQLEIRNRLLTETFGRYLSDDVVRAILDTPDGLAMGGKRREATVLMSDLRDFTALCETMDADAVISMLNHYFEIMYEEIERFGGTLLEFMGDGLFVVFGAPVEAERHASRAVAAALSMQKRMSEVNEWNRAHGFRHLAMGIGLNTGSLIVGNIGSERRSKYGVMGSTVNLASRAESYTSEGQILITDATRLSVPEELRVDREIRVIPKGVTEPMRLSLIGGIGGPYGIFLETRAKTPLRPLDPPTPVTIRPVNGKHVSDERIPARITASSEQEALIEAERDPASLSVFLEDGPRRYGRILSREGNVLRIEWQG